MAKTYWDTLPAKQIKLAQEQKLLDYLRRSVLPLSPYYRELMEGQGLGLKDFRSREDLGKLPFSCKADIAPAADEPGRPLRLVLQPPEVGPDMKKAQALGIKWSRMVLGREKYRQRLLFEYNPSHVHFTTGRTALPTPIFYTPYDLTLTRECGRRMAEVIGLRTEDTMVNAFPFAPHLSFWMAYFTAEVMGAAAVHTGGGKVLGSARILDSLERFKATVLAGTPGYCYYLLRQAARDNRDLSAIKIIILGGERAPAGMRAKMQDLLRQMNAGNVRIFGSYAFTEGRVAWMECREAVEKGESSGYHLYPDRELIEVLDPESGEPVGEGEEGEIVYTSLGWRGSALLRYRTGDLVKEGLTFEPCPYCKRTVPRLGPTIKRLSDYKEFQMTKVKGTLVDLNALYPILSGHPGVQEWQLVIDKRNDDPFDLDELYLYVTPMEGFKERALKQELEEIIQRELEVTPTKITFQSLDKLLDRLGMDTNTKELRIVDQRPAGN